jgi:hypothetical protein
VGKLSALEGTEMGLGVADVDREQHAFDYRSGRCPRRAGPPIRSA